MCNVGEKGQEARRPRRPYFSIWSTLGDCTDGWRLGDEDDYNEVRGSRIRAQEPVSRTSALLLALPLGSSQFAYFLPDIEVDLFKC